MTLEHEIRWAHELSAGTLAAFATGLSWPAIHALDRKRGSTWWRQAVADAEHRGLLEWDRELRAWRLTAEGREHVRFVS